MSKGTVLEALISEMLGDVGRLHEQVTRLNMQLPTTLKSFEAMNEKLLADRSKIAESFKVRGAPTDAPEKSIIFAALATCIVFLLTLGLGIYLGISMAKYKSSQDIAWLSSPMGQAAKRLADADSLLRLDSCSGRGWRTEEEDGKTYCMPYPYTEDGKQLIIGWETAIK